MYRGPRNKEAFGYNPAPIKGLEEFEMSDDFPAKSAHADDSSATGGPCGFEAALEKEWERIRKEEQIGAESFITPGYHAYEDGIIPLCRFARQYTLTKDPLVLGVFKELQHLRHLLAIKLGVTGELIPGLATLNGTDAKLAAFAKELERLK